MRIQITNNNGIVEITVPEKDHLEHIRKFLKKYSLEGPVREILKDGRKEIIDMEGEK